jgi:hypothetical protein
MSLGDDQHLNSVSSDLTFDQRSERFFCWKIGWMTLRTSSTLPRKNKAARLLPCSYNAPATVPKTFPYGQEN